MRDEAANTSRTRRFVWDALGLLAGELFVALHDHVTVERVEFHQERFAARLLRGNQRAAAAAEEVQHVLAGREEYCIARTANSTGFSTSS